MKLALSRRKQGFETPRERKLFQVLTPPIRSSSPFLGSFWGISDREQGWLTADIDGDFDGSGESRAAHRISHSSRVRGLSDML
jgi:hypothetical protein